MHRADDRERLAVGRFESIFRQVVELLHEEGLISLDVQYIDGTKIESVANKYTFVWKGSVEKNKAKLWIWAEIIVIIKIVNQISSLIIIKKFCFPHTIANKLTGFLLFLTVPTISWHIIPIAIVALIATFAALQEWHSIRNKIDIV